MVPDPFDMLPAKKLTFRSAKAGEVLFREGAETSGMYLSLSAVVRLERVGTGGEPVTIHTVPPGQSFAEASVFSDRYHCDAVVTSEGEIVRVSKSVILEGFSDPGFAAAYNRIMSRQVQSYRQIVEIISTRSAVERVYAAMVAGLLDGPIITFAGRIALTHEATYRALRTLVDQGRIENPERGRYVLPTR